MPKQFSQCYIYNIDNYKNNFNALKSECDVFKAKGHLPADEMIGFIQNIKPLCAVNINEGMLGVKSLKIAITAHGSTKSDFVSTHSNMKEVGVSTIKISDINAALRQVSIDNDCDRVDVYMFICGYGQFALTSGMINNSEGNLYVHMPDPSVCDTTVMINDMNANMSEIGPMRILSTDNSELDLIHI